MAKNVVLPKMLLGPLEVKRLSELCEISMYKESKGFIRWILKYTYV